jgi:membrane-bound ClpP family serine protease
MSPDPTLDDFNPYRSPAISPSTERPSLPSFPVALILLTFLAVGHVLISLAMLGIGLLAASAPAIGGGLACCGFYVAIVIGLTLRREWARIMIIWLSYVGIISYLIQTALVPLAALVTLPLMVFEIATLVFAHSRAVRETTRGASMAKAYTYHESPQTGKEEA